MPKLFATGSIYRTMATIQRINDAVMIWCEKKVSSTSRHTQAESLSGPCRDGCMGLRPSGHSWKVAVAHEWV